MGNWTMKSNKNKNKLLKLKIKLLNKLKKKHNNQKVKWKLKKRNNQKKRKPRNKKLLNITELAKLVKDFVLCLQENILAWLTKKSMLQKWSRKLPKRPRNLRRKQKE